MRSGLQEYGRSQVGLYLFLGMNDRLSDELIVRRCK